jgi:anti-sigma B factor antagonist
MAVFICVKLWALGYVWYEPGVSLLEITVDSGDSGSVVRLSGESDLSTAGQLSEALNAQVASGAQHLTIDLSGLRFADSATIRNFIEIHQKFKNSGGTLELLNPQPTVAHAISLLGVDQVLTVRTKSDPEDQPTIP